MITHLHPDHAFFINEDLDDTGLRLYAPEKARNVTDLTQRINTIYIDSYSVTPIPTHHSKNVKSNAYLIDDGKNKLLYTGDIIWINKEFHPLLAGLSMVITDGSYLRRGGLVRKDKETGLLFGHTGIPDLIHLFGQFDHCLLFVRFGSWFYKDIKTARKKLSQLGKSAGVKLLVGYDGMELDVHKLPRAQARQPG